MWSWQGLKVWFNIYILKLKNPYGSLKYSLNLLIYVNITLFSANNHKKESGSVLWEFTFSDIYIMLKNEYFKELYLINTVTEFVFIGK